jgi:hypothetical protein
VVVAGGDAVGEGAAVVVVGDTAPIFRPGPGGCTNQSDMRASRATNAPTITMTASPSL